MPENPTKQHNHLTGATSDTTKLSFNYKFDWKLPYSLRTF